MASSSVATLEVAVSTGASALGWGPDSSADSAATASGLPHSGQNIAGSRNAAPHDAHRCEISGCIINFGLRIANCELSKRGGLLKLNGVKTQPKFAIRNPHFEIPRFDA